MFAPKRQSGICAPFVDPAIQAPDAPVRWLAATGVATLMGSTARVATPADADLALERLSCVKHIVVGPDFTQWMLVHSTTMALVFELRGEQIAAAPVNITILIDGLANAKSAGALLLKLPTLLSSEPRRVLSSVSRILLRTALIAVDGRRVGASYREVADVAFGTKDASKAWTNPGRAMKDHVIRASKHGAALVGGGYARLLSQK
jgi:Uncharacterized conserved protein (DUF2285)